MSILASFSGLFGYPASEKPGDAVTAKKAPDIEANVSEYSSGVGKTLISQRKTETVVASPESDLVSVQVDPNNNLNKAKAFFEEVEAAICKVDVVKWTSAGAPKSFTIDELTTADAARTQEVSREFDGTEIVNNTPQGILRNETGLSQREFNAHELAYNLQDGVIVRQENDKGEVHLYKAYKVVGPNIEAGLNAFILVPQHLPTDGETVEVKLVFRGTKDLPSAIRDMEDGGAGAESMQKALGDLNEALDITLEAIRRKNQNSPIKLQFDGHSLAGADIQNYVSYLLEQIVYQKQTRPIPSTVGSDDFEYVDLRYGSFDHIVGIDVFTKNSAGVPTDTQKRVAKSLNELRSLQNPGDLNIKIKHMMVKGDLVQSTSECHIGANIRPEDADVSIINIHTCSETSYLARHTGKYLGSEARRIPIAVEKVSNKTEKGLKKLEKIIGKVPENILHNRTVKQVQHYVHRFLKPVTSVFRSW